MVFYLCEMSRKVDLDCYLLGIIQLYTLNVFFVRSGLVHTMQSIYMYALCTDVCTIFMPCY